MKSNSKAKNQKAHITKPTENKTLGSPHDKFFKVIYSSPEKALDIFKILFPQVAYEKCNWNKLKAEKETFTDKQADLVFSVPLKADPKSKIKIFILIEHKSYYSKNLFRQILDYQNSIYQGDKSGDIISVVPIVFYHGKKPWQWEASFQKGYCGKFLTEIPSFFWESMLNYHLILFDTNSPNVGRFFKAEEIKSRGALNVLKRIWSLKKTVPGLLEVVTLFLSGFADREKKDLTVGLFNYLHRAGGVSFNLLKKVETEAVKKGILKKGGYMNFTEEIKKEAKLEGWQKGQKEGWQKGRQEEKRQVILKMLQKKTDISFISEVTGLSEREIKKLKNSF